MSCYLHSQGEDPPKICGPCSEMSGLKSASVGVRNVPCVVCLFFLGHCWISWFDPRHGFLHFAFYCFPLECMMRLSSTSILGEVSAKYLLHRYGHYGFCTKNMLFPGVMRPLHDISSLKNLLIMIPFIRISHEWIRSKSWRLSVECSLFSC